MEILFYLLFLICLIASHVCEAGRYCVTPHSVEYCSYGCCEDDDRPYYYRCCKLSFRFGLALILGIVSTLIYTAVIVWLCRRRYKRRAARRRNELQQGVLENGHTNFVNTADLPPGYTFPDPSSGGPLAPPSYEATLHLQAPLDNKNYQPPPAYSEIAAKP